MNALVICISVCIIALFFIQKHYEYLNKCLKIQEDSTEFLKGVISKMSNFLDKLQKQTEKED